jgi:hypothetical protein
MNKNNLFNHESSRRYVETTTHQAASEAVALTETPPSTNRWEGFALGMILVVWTALFLRRLLIQKKRYAIKPHHCQQSIPCRNCRFAYHSFFLKCAVHPSKAMKKEAIGCSDYWAKDSDTFSQ